MRNAKKIALISTLGLIAACSTNQGYLAVDTGLALEQGLAKQIIDPNPAEGAPMATTEKEAGAIERYRNDEVKDPSPEEMPFIISE
ncbi:MAG: hypothetical protein ACX94B_16375 [Henriciella sp.]